MPLFGNFYFIDKKSRWLWISQSFCWTISLSYLIFHFSCPQNYELGLFPQTWDDQVCPSVGRPISRFVGWSVCHNLMKGRKLHTIICFYWSTFYWYLFSRIYEYLECFSQLVNRNFKFPSDCFFDPTKLFKLKKKWYGMF